MLSPEPEIVEVPVVEAPPEGVQWKKKLDTSSELEEAFIANMIPEEVNQVALPTFEEEASRITRSRRVESVSLPTAEQTAPPVAPPTAETVFHCHLVSQKSTTCQPLRESSETLIQELLDSWS